MAPATSYNEGSNQAMKPRSVKELVESNGVTSIPSSYSITTTHNFSSHACEPESLPVIDYSQLTSSDPQQRSIAIQDLEIACLEWGFFLLVNHDIPESLMKELVEGYLEFFDMPLDEKQEYAAGRDIWRPIRFGTGVDVKVADFFMWRDFLKTFVHPHFNFPNKPQALREIVRQYTTETRTIFLELLRGISETLGLEPDYIAKATNAESGFSLLAANLYPPCPQPELAMGLPPHSDPGLITFLIQNDVGGLQIKHKGEWFNANPRPNSIVVNIADQLEILTNGKYKSVMHRAVVNKSATRISIPIANGPSLDTLVSPAKELVERDGTRPAYNSMLYKEYIEFQQTSTVPGMSSLDQLRYPVD